MKKVLSLVLALLMILACTPIVMAESEFEYEDYEGGIAINGYNGPGGAVTIPAEIDGKKVVAVIGTVDKPSALHERKDITKVIISEGVEVVGRYAFSKTTSLKEVVLPSTLKTIGFEAFKLTSITSIEIPEGVTEIQAGAFNDTKLTSIHIPKNAKLNGSIVAYCDSLKKITVDSTNPYYAADGKFLYSKNEDKTAVNYAGGIVDKRVTIPSYILNIGQYCFRYNTHIETIITHKNLIKIGYWTFDGCTNLKEIYVTGKNTVVSNDIVQNNPNLIVYTNGKIDGFADGPKDTSDNFTVKPYIEGMENPTTTTTTEKAKETTTKPSTSKTEKPAEKENVTESTTETTATSTVLESETLKETEVNAVVDSGNTQTTGADNDKNNTTPIIIGVVAVVTVGAVATGVTITLKKKKK